MAPAETHPTKAAALEAALDEVRRCVLAKVYVCVQLIGGRGRINVTEIRRNRKLVKRYRWSSGEVA